MIIGEFNFYKLFYMFQISENKTGAKFQLKDPFNDTEALNVFVQEVEKFEKFVEGLTAKTLNGPTPLDIKWKELLDLQVYEQSTLLLSIIDQLSNNMFRLHRILG